MTNFFIRYFHNKKRQQLRGLHPIHPDQINNNNNNTRRAIGITNKQTHPSAKRLNYEHT